MRNPIRYIFILLFITATGKSFAQFTCSINLVETADTGCFPFPILAVPEEDTTNPIVERKWILTTCSGVYVDSSANGLNPNFSYEPTSSGCYCLSLEIIYQDGQTCTAQKCNIVEADASTISATITPSSICIGGTVNLALQDVPNCGTIDTTYVVWPCTGISTYVGNPSTVSNTFTNSCTQGTYDLSILVKNSCGCFSSKTYNNAITIVPSPVANFSANVTSAYCVNSLTSSFTATPQNYPGITYCWYVNGAQEQCGTSNLFSYTFPASPNCYNIKLVVLQASGCVDSLTQDGYICVYSAVNPSFTLNEDSVCLTPGDSTHLCMTSNTPGTKTWTITGPGNFSATGTGSTYCVNLSAAGFYNIGLAVSNGPNCNGAITTNNAFQIKTAIAPCFTLSDTFSCLTNFCITATNCTTPTAAGYDWSFGQGAQPQTSNLATPPQVCYAGLGQRNVTLQTTAGNGCVTTASKSITADTLVPSFIFNHVRGCAPLTVKFNSTTDTAGFPDQVSNYTWSFPGASPPIPAQSGTTLSSITQIFDLPGCYNVRLTLTTKSGCSSSTQLNNVICTGTKPNPCLMVDTPTVKCYDSLPVTFILMCDSFNQAIISFGDGTTQTIGSSAINAPVMAVDTIKYVYGDCGSFTVKAVALRDSCPSDTLIATVKINCPKPQFYDSISCRTGDSVYFINTSTGATRYHWAFSCLPVTDTVDAENPVVDLPHCIACTATLIAYNDSLGCSFHKYLPFTTSCTGPPSLSPANIAGCSCFAPIIKNTTPGASSGTTWWDFDPTAGICPIGGGGTDCYEGTVLNPNFCLDAGNYPMAMVYYSPGGCIDTLFDTVHVCKLTVDFNPVANCLPDSFYFMGSATDSFCDGKFKWNWDFSPGTGGPANVQNPVVLYASAGQYPVTLTVTDSTGCSATVTKNIAIGTAVFDKWTFDTLICPNTPVCITNTTSSADPLTQEWYFPGASNIDSFSGQTPQPCPIYDSSGVYPIIYHVEAGTCDKTDTQDVDVHFPVPRAVVFKNFFPCPQAQEGVLFLDSSLYVDESVDSANWTFYDTVRHIVHSTSTAWQPSVFFPLAGVYIATLCITTNTGCTVCANVDTITVLGPYGTIEPTVTFACSTCLDTITFLAETVNATKMIFIAGCNQGFVVDSPLAEGTQQNPTISTFKVAYCVTDTCLPEIVIRDTANCNVIIYSPAVSIDTPTVNFTYSNYKVCDSGTVAFFDSTQYHLPPLPPGYDSSYTVSWLWNFGDNTSAKDTSTLQNPSYYYSHPGTYQVTLIIGSNFGCLDSIKKTIIVYPQPTAAFSLSDSAICSNNAVCITDLSSATVPIISWIWNYGDNSTSTDSAPPCHQYSAPYNSPYSVSVLVIDSNGCEDSSTVPLKVFTAPTANFDWQVTCENQPMPFYNTSVPGSGALDSCLYTFWVGAATPELNPNCNTTFTFTAGLFPVQFIVGDVNGCFDTIIKTVQSDPLTKLSVQPGDTVICVGNSVNYSLAGVYDTILWSPNVWINNPDSQQVAITPNGDVTYTVVAQSGVCPPADTTFTILVVQTVPIGLSTFSTTIVTGLTTQLNLDSLPLNSDVIQIDSIVWSPDSSLTCSGCPNPTASPTHTTTYTVTVYYSRDGYICSRSEQVTVDVLSTCDSGTIFVPNTFTPNGDGINDVFMIRGSGIIKIDYFRVFNRWGDLLFDEENGVPNDKQYGWNGTDRNGGKLNDGVYVYIYEVECINKDKFTGKGNVTLLR